MIALVVLLFSNMAFAEDVLSCDFNYMGAPFVTVELIKESETQYANYVRVNHHGSEHLESFAQEASGPGELLHGWVSKESSENSLEIIVYLETTNGANAKLINPHVPIGREMPGICR